MGGLGANGLKVVIKYVPTLLNKIIMVLFFRKQKQNQQKQNQQSLQSN